MTNRKSAAAVTEHAEHKLERALICACTRMRLSESDRTHLNGLLTADIDWAHLLNLAQRHALAPLIYRQTQKCDTGLVPGEYLQKLKIAY